MDLFDHLKFKNKYHFDLLLQLYSQFGCILEVWRSEFYAQCECVDYQTSYDNNCGLAWINSSVFLTCGEKTMCVVTCLWETVQLKIPLWMFARLIPITFLHILLEYYIIYLLYFCFPINTHTYKNKTIRIPILYSSLCKQDGCLNGLKAGTFESVWQLSMVT